MIGEDQNLAAVISAQVEGVIVAIVEFVRDYLGLVVCVFFTPWKAGWLLLFQSERQFPRCRPIPSLCLSIFLYSTTAIASFRPNVSIFGIFDDLADTFVSNFSLTHALWSTLPTLLAVVFLTHVASLAFVPSRRQCFRDATYCIVAAQTAALFLVLLLAYVLLALAEQHMINLSPEAGLAICKAVLPWVGLFLIFMPLVNWLFVAGHLSSWNRWGMPSQKVWSAYLLGLAILTTSTAYSVQQMPRAVGFFRWHPVPARIVMPPATRTKPGP